jgi:hypothetical protein
MPSHRKPNTPVLYDGRWAYAPIGATGARELYDLEIDPYAEHNVSVDHPTLVDDLHQRLLAWLEDIGAPPEAIAMFV